MTNPANPANNIAIAITNGELAAKPCLQDNRWERSERSKDATERALGVALSGGPRSGPAAEDVLHGGVPDGEGSPPSPGDTDCDPEQQHGTDSDQQFSLGPGNYTLVRTGTPVRTWNESRLGGPVVYVRSQYAQADGDTPIAIGICLSRIGMIPSSVTAFEERFRFGGGNSRLRPPALFQSSFARLSTTIV